MKHHKLLDLQHCTGGIPGLWICEVVKAKHQSNDRKTQILLKGLLHLSWIFKCPNLLIKKK